MRSIGQGQSQTWVVLPTYNEAGNLPTMLEAIRAALPLAHVLVVDDGSPDGTGRIADKAAASDPRIEVQHRSEKAGLGAAYRAGFAALLQRRDPEVIIQMDCDFSHDAADAPRLIRALESGADLAIGSRYVPGGATPGWTWQRRAVSRGGSAFARLLLRLPVRDLTGGFKAWRRETLEKALGGEPYAQGYGFQIETSWRAARAGARIVEVPITFHERRAGKSKMSGQIAREALMVVLVMWWNDMRGRSDSVRH